MLILVLTESAVETIPQGLWTHPAVQRYSKQRRKHPQFLLLDRSYHHSALKALKNNEKRGLPDIVHFALLEALGSPLNKEELLQVYLHTVNDNVITVNSEARLPRNYTRFVGLMEQLFEFGKVPPSGKTLLNLEREMLPQLIGEIKPSYVVTFSRAGTPHTLEETVSRLSGEKKTSGARRRFSPWALLRNNVKLANEIVCIDPEMLET